jgi:Helix-loop-helix DNA-binding domain
MRVLSSAFYRLKTIIPWVPHDTKLSKLDTLRLARNYIAYLTATLDGQPVNEITNKMPHPQKMVSARFPLFMHKKSEVKSQTRKSLFKDSNERVQVEAVRSDFNDFLSPSSRQSRGKSTAFN